MMRPSRRSRPSVAAGVVVDLTAHCRREAMERAGRLLTLRPRTRIEMVERLADAGFDAEVVAATVDRLEELRLVDDAAFARQWIEERARTRGRPPAVLLRELAAKGVDPTVAREALEEMGPDEAAQAAGVAARLVPRYTDLPLHRQAARLLAALGRRGFSEEAAEAGVRAVLPPAGWD
jgi:regulatory protein